MAEQVSRRALKAAITLSLLEIALVLLWVQYCR
jgi:hypothetical protein